MEGGMSSSVRPSSEKNQEVRPDGPQISSVSVLVTEGITTRDKALQASSLLSPQRAEKLEGLSWFPCLGPSRQQGHGRAAHSCVFPSVFTTQSSL